MLNLADIQANVVRGYPATLAEYVWVKVTDRELGRRFIGELAEEVGAASEKHASIVNVALTYGGLEALGVPDDLRRTFPDDFRRGMRRAKLGDPPGEWEKGLGDGEAHVLVWISARRRDVLERRRRAAFARVDGPDDGLERVHHQHAEKLPSDGLEYGPREHFGFADGLSQPTIEGTGEKEGPRFGDGVPLRRGAWRALKPGEFVLGHEDEEGVVPEAPAPPLGQSGTFMVYRKLEQDVAGFRRFVLDAAGGDPERADEIAAKIVGRSQNGDALVPKKGTNDFRYGSDPRGEGCPLGSHIRRANPRDALGWQGKLSRRHRIIRRGMPYGPPLAPGLEDDGNERGLIFVCFNASIGRQYEVIQQRWCNEGDAFGLGSDCDPLLGGQGSGKFTIQGNPPTFIDCSQGFVHMRGGEYLFVPGLSALRALAAGPRALRRAA